MPPPGTPSNTHTHTHHTHRCCARHGHAHRHCHRHALTPQPPPPPRRPLRRPPCRLRRCLKGKKPDDAPVAAVTTNPEVDTRGADTHVNAHPDTYDLRVLAGVGDVTLPGVQPTPHHTPHHHHHAHHHSDLELRPTPHTHPPHPTSHLDSHPPTAAMRPSNVPTIPSVAAVPPRPLHTAPPGAHRGGRQGVEGLGASVDLGKVLSSGVLGVPAWGAHLPAPGPLPGPRPRLVFAVDTVVGAYDPTRVGSKWSRQRVGAGGARHEQPNDEGQQGQQGQQGGASNPDPTSPAAPDTTHSGATPPASHQAILDDIEVVVGRSSRQGTRTSTAAKPVPISLHHPTHMPLAADPMRHPMRPSTSPMIGVAVPAAAAVAAVAARPATAAAGDGYAGGGFTYGRVRTGLALTPASTPSTPSGGVGGRVGGRVGGGAAGLGLTTPQLSPSGPPAWGARSPHRTPPSPAAGAAGTATVSLASPRTALTPLGLAHLVVSTVPNVVDSAPGEPTKSHAGVGRRYGGSGGSSGSFGEWEWGDGDGGGRGAGAGRVISTAEAQSVGLPHFKSPGLVGVEHVMVVSGRQVPVSMLQVNAMHAEDRGWYS